MTTGDSVSWLENRYCASVAATLFARMKYFDLLEDATVSPARLARARAEWRSHAEQTEILKNLFSATKN